jgi:4-coumarate--CoA ligase
VILAHAIWWAGAVLSPINTSGTAKDIAHCIDVVKPTHIAVSAPFLETLKEAIKTSDLAKSGKDPKIFSVLDKIEGLQKARDFDPFRMETQY